MIVCIQLFPQREYLQSLVCRLGSAETSDLNYPFVDIAVGVEVKEDENDVWMPSTGRWSIVTGHYGIMVMKKR